MYEFSAELDFINHEKHNIKYKVKLLKRGVDMLAINYTSMRNKMKDYFDKVTDDCETVIVTRKGEKNERPQCLTSTY